MKIDTPSPNAWLEFRAVVWAATHEPVFNLFWPCFVVPRIKWMWEAYPRYAEATLTLELHWNFSYNGLQSAWYRAFAESNGLDPVLFDEILPF